MAKGMEHKSYKERPRELWLFRRRKGGSEVTLSTVALQNSLRGGCSRGVRGVSLYSEAARDRRTQAPGKV